MSDSLALPIEALYEGPMGYFQTEEKDTFSDKDCNDYPSQNMDVVIDRKNIERIYRMDFPKEWEKENIAKPNISCKESAEKIITDLFKKYHFLPDRIAPAIEEGIFFNYKNMANDKEIYIEVYNTLEAVGAVVQNKKTLKCLDIINDDFSEIFKSFVEM
ncbi:MAG: hypothetical protein KAS64_07575 [Spirochaetes bacterium]|nr:hypothetical protein [Spirochaetota bacterium]